jgi:pilus assembly protein CpaE
MHDKTLCVEVKVRNPLVGKKLGVIIQSNAAFRLRNAGDTRKPDLVIFELGKDTKRDFQLIQSLLDGDAFGEIFLTAETADPTVLLQAMRIGAKEFFFQPLKEEEVRQALERFKDRRGGSSPGEPGRFGHIISVMGSKGGVGTTTVAVNLAVSIAEQQGDHSVALVDMNAVRGEISLFLAVKPSYHWGEITRNIDRLDNTFLMNILAEHASGVYVLPSPSQLNGYPTVTPETMERVLGILRSMFDFVIIDGGQSIDEAYLKVIELSDEALIISILSLPCLHNTNKLLKSLMNLSILTQDRIKVVINRYLKKSDVSLKEGEQSIHKKIFWSIPNDYKATMSAINQGKPLSQISARASITRNIRELAEVLAQGEGGEGKKKKSFRFLK